MSTAGRGLVRWLRAHILVCASFAAAFAWAAVHPWGIVAKRHGPVVLSIDVISIEGVAEAASNTSAIKVQVAVAELATIIVARHGH
jgi:hypothetical protein